MCECGECDINLVNGVGVFYIVEWDDDGLFVTVVSLCHCLLALV